jgi:hypothetical protein
MNSSRDIAFKPCGCTDAITGRQFAGRCPHLAARQLVLRRAGYYRRRP